MRKIFLAVLAVMIMMCGAAGADIIYTTESGNMGLIEITEDGVSAPAVKYSGAGSNAFVGTYWDGEDTRVILIERSPESYDRALVFSQSNMTTPVGDYVELDGVKDTRAVANSLYGTSIYFASYGSSSLCEFDTENFTPRNSYIHEQENSRDIYPHHVVGVRTDYRYVYALIDVSPYRSLYLRFDGTLERDKEAFYSDEIDSSTSSMAQTGSGLMFACSDGVKYFGRDGLAYAVSSDSPVKSICADDGSGFYFMTQYQSGDVSFDVIAHYSSGTSTISEHESGSVSMLVKDTNYSVLAAVTGGKILLYDMEDDTLIAEYDSTELGGVPVHVSASRNDGAKDERSSGSCSLSGMGAAMLLVFAVNAKKRLRL